jgi:hypothetical protein
MNQHPDERQLALYAGRDLLEKEVRILEEHVTDCAPCAATLTDFRSTREWLRASATDPAPGDLENVRVRVMTVLSSDQAARYWRKWLSAAAVAAIIAFSVAVFLRPVRQPIVPHKLERLQVSAPAMVRNLERKPIVQARARAPRRQEAGLRKVELITHSGAPDTLRMTTADPSVVILLQVGERMAEDE